jgi:TPR repeat protein
VFAIFIFTELSSVISPSMEQVAMRPPQAGAKNRQKRLQHNIKVIGNLQERRNMRLVDYSHQMLHASDPIAEPSETAKPVAKTSVFLRWLPGLFLVAMILASVLLGSPNKARDELDWLSRLANNGDAGAQLQLGLAYRDGRYDLTPDLKTAMYWLKQSASGGNAYAENALGSAYAKGQGTERDLKLAQQWWRKAVKDGDPEARLHLADTLIRAGQTQEANQLLM